MKLTHKFTLNSRYRHNDPKYGEGTYSQRARQIDKQRAEKGEVYLEFDGGIMPVSIQYLKQTW